MRSVLTILIIILVGFLVSIGAIEVYKFYSVRFQSVEREVFEETQSYTHGTIQQLARYHYKWVTGNDLEKKAIANLVRHQFSQFPPEKIQNPELRKWFENVIAGRY